MIRPMGDVATPTLMVHSSAQLAARLADLTEFATSSRPTALSRHPRWLQVFHDALSHDVYAIEATSNGQTCGFLPIAFVSSILFGRFLVSLPYLNSNGVIASTSDVQSLLIDRAIALADELRVKYLELRHEQPIEHSALNGTLTNKVHMRLRLPSTPEKLWKSFDSKVRNQVRKGEKQSFAVSWGREELLDPFYQVLSENMRDLGTPVFGRKLFRLILQAFPADAELCVLRQGEIPVAAALLLHGNGVTEVPTASSLRQYNSSCANMLMYWNMLKRAVERKQQVFDFGRSSPDSPTYQFKKQWGAQAEPAAWQYYLRGGSTSDLRPDNPRFRLLINTWKKLPLWLTRWIGPPIARVIP